MPKTKISEFSATPANNTDIDSINLAEGCAPSGINDALRELMAQLKDFQTGAVGDSFNGPIGTSTAAAGAFTTLSASSTLGVTGVATLGAGAILNTPASVTLTNATGLPLTTGTTGTLATSKGGTNLTSFTSGGVVYASSSSALATGSALTFDGTTLENLGAFGSSTSSLNLKNSSTASTSNIVEQQFWARDTFTGLTQKGAFGLDTSLGVGNQYGDFYWKTSYAGAPTEKMRLTSAGNLGIGTSSPSQKLTVSGGIASIAGISALTASSAFFDYNSGNGRFAAVSATTGTAAPITFSQYSSNGSVGRDAVTIDSSGNLGLGTAPSAWGAGTSVIDLNTGGSAGAVSSSGTLSIANNGFFNGTNWIYKNSSTALTYQLISGQHRWNIAPSGTAGNPITFTQAMTLNADGQLLLGTTSAFDSAYTMSLKVAGATGGLIIQPASDGYTAIGFNNASGVGKGSISVSSTATAYNTSSDYRLKNITGSLSNSGAYIDSLNPVEGTWKEDGSIFVGLIAHEVQEASRTQVATGTKDGQKMQGMDYSSAEIIANLIAEVKSLRVRVAQLETN